MINPINVKQLAEVLHTICCHMNHTDQCAWYYSDNNDVHIYYEEAAQKLVDQYGFGTAQDMIVKIRKVQFGERIEDI